MSEELSSEYSGHKALIFTALYIPTQVICVALRYLSRYLVRGSWGSDDIFIMASLVFQMAMGVICICSVYFGGVGYHIDYLEKTTPATVLVWGKYLVAISLLYFWTVSIPKIAILVLYHRLFPTPRLRRVVVSVAGVLVALTFATGISAFAACRPFAANWNPMMHGANCINKEALFRWASFPNIVTDIVIILLPMRTIWHLKTSRRLKIGLVATFAVGTFGFVGSIVRFVMFFKRNSFIDGTWSAVDLIIWTQLETGTYLMSACVMTYRPILERLASMRFRNRLSSKSDSARSREGLGSNQQPASIALKPMPQKGMTGFLPLSDSPHADSRIVITTDISHVRDSH